MWVIGGLAPWPFLTRSRSPRNVPRCTLRAICARVRLPDGAGAAAPCKHGAWAITGPPGEDCLYRRTGTRVRYFDEPIREQVASEARPALLHLMANHQPGGCDPAALLEVVDTYLRLNPLDEEVLEAREELLRRGFQAR
jgi:hypothetical protein